MTPTPDHDSPSGAHRFILLGQTDLVAYHLALFHVPAHAFQVVLTIDFTDEAARTAYLDDLKAPIPPGKKRYHSLAADPEDPFPLTDIESGKRTSFKALVERVWVDVATGDRKFEGLKDSKNPVTTVRILPSGMRYFAPIGDTPYPPHFTGLVFGTTKETFLAHKLAKPDHWDEVLQVTTTPSLTQDILDKVPQVTVPSVRDTLVDGVPLNEQISPFTENTAYQGKLTPRAGGTATDVSLTVGVQLWWNSTSLNTAKP
ncbi:hypothetical protein ACFRAR_04505 [Kitasatospora sp. NPDC056651]|uniref:hypothetical protein n=1 Tax=Kitasatospora sp. NPDC056651 TaxID=3345892 RepID=UPI0036762F83